MNGFAYSLNPVQLSTSTSSSSGESINIDPRKSIALCVCVCVCVFNDLVLHASQCKVVHQLF